MCAYASCAEDCRFHSTQSKEERTMTRTEQRIAYFRAKGVKFVKDMPKGWKTIQGATTAPSGYIWIYNGANPFHGNNEYALLKL